jgi:hypothetical protein
VTILAANSPQGRRVTEKLRQRAPLSPDDYDFLLGVLFGASQGVGAQRLALSDQGWSNAQQSKAGGVTVEAIKQSKRRERRRREKEGHA